MTSLSDTQRTVLSAACRRPGRRILPLPDHLKGGAAGKVLDSLAGKGLIEEVAAGPDEPVWREDPTGRAITLAATDAAFTILGVGDEPAGDDPEAAPADAIDDAPAIDDTAADVADADEEPGSADATPDGETAVLVDAAIEPIDHTALDDASPEPDAEPDPGNAPVAEADEPVTITPEGMPAVLAEAATRIAVLEGIRDSLVAAGHAETIALAGAEWLDRVIERAINPPAKPARTPRSTTPRAPRTDTKQEQVLTLLRRDSGATLDEIAEVTAWKHHTIRGFFAGALKKKLGLEVTSKKVDGRRVYRVAA